MFTFVVVLNKQKSSPSFGGLELAESTKIIVPLPLKWRNYYVSAKKETNFFYFALNFS